MNREIYYKYFEEKVKPLIYTMEEERKKTVRNVLLSSFFMFVCGIICAYVFLRLAIKSDFILLVLPLILFLMYVFFIKSIINFMLKGREYQNNLISNIMPYFFEPVANFKFWPKNRDVVSFLDSELFPDFETREDSLSFFGIYKDTNITLSSTKLVIPPDRTVFSGITIILEFNKTTDNHVVFISKDKFKFNGYKQVNPHIDELNRYLYTFAENDNISFITEDFWKCLKRIGEAYSAKGFRLSYDNKTMLIAMEQKHPFQFGFLFKSLLKAQNYDELFDMFISIFDLIDNVVSN